MTESFFLKSKVTRSVVLFGRKLFVGSDSTELDHRICRSAGGEEKIENCGICSYCIAKKNKSSDTKALVILIIKLL